MMFSSCSKENSKINSEGEGSALLNQMYWPNHVWLTFVDSTLHFNVERGYKEGGVYSAYESLALSWIEKKVNVRQRLYLTDSLAGWNNSYPDRAHSLFFTSASDRHAGCAVYKLIQQDSIHNWIEIIEQKNNFKSIKARYQAAFYKESACKDNTLPDTLRITAGVINIGF